MGVYIYKSLHMDAIKIGHYCKNNAWSRVAHRGFNSCICPGQIIGKVNVDDVELLYWFPALKPSDEKMFHRILKEFRICGEWFRIEALARVSCMDSVNRVSECSKEAAVLSSFRL